MLDIVNDTALDILRRRRVEDPSGIQAMYSSYLGGVVTDPALMVIPLDDHMVHRGHGVFDTASLRNGNIYRLDVHLDRLLESARLARIEHGFTKDELRSIVVGTVAASGRRDGSLRYWITAGPGGMSFDPSECSGPCFYCVVLDGFNPASASMVTDGLHEITIRNTPMKPPLLAHIKSNNYLLNVLTHLEAHDAGGHFGVLVDDDGFVAEGCVVNVSFVRSADRFLVTPPFRGILKGATVRRTETLAQVLIGEGLITGFSQEPLVADDLRGAIDEMYFTGGDTHLFPVVSWDKMPVGDGTVGPVARRVLELLEAEEGGDRLVIDSDEQFIAVDYRGSTPH